MAELKNCPICGAKAFLSHDVVDGFDFGYSVGCPRYCIGDGIHGVDTFEESDKLDENGLNLTGFMFYSKKDAEEWWNRRADNA